MSSHDTPQEFNSLSAEARHQRAMAHDRCATFNRSPSKGNLKKILGLFKEKGDNLIIERGFHCDYGIHISFGSNVFVNINCTMLDGGLITIGDDTLIGPNVQIITINHPLSPGERLKKKNLAQDVSIGKNVWIGAGSIILPGANIGSGTVVGAGSIVSGHLDANALYLGAPARKVKLLS